MFSYYGSKSKIVDYYPPPKHDKIIEPFAGSARYSLKWFDRDVLLVDKYEVIVRIWKWLQQASEKDITGLPRLKEGDKLSDFTFDCEEARLLMGFHTAHAVAVPQNTATFRATTHRPKWINYSLKQIANNLHKIRHWEIKQADYSDIANQSATWFIDPPYQFGGEHYKENNADINFDHLAQWCKSRDGQVIVCENTKANWMPFTPIKEIQGSKHKTTEAIWTNYQTHYDFKQAALFG